MPVFFLYIPLEGLSHRGLQHSLSRVHGFLPYESMPLFGLCWYRNSPESKETTRGFAILFAKRSRIECNEDFEFSERRYPLINKEYFD